MAIMTTANKPMSKEEKESLKKLIKPFKEVKIVNKEDKKISKGEFKNLIVRS
jgi:hypothetical protein